MIIGIDISMLVYQGSGVATYTTNLVEALLHYYPQHTYKLFYSSLRRPPDLIPILTDLRKKGALVYDYRLPPRILKFAWNKSYILPVEWLIGKVDVFHSSDFLRPPLFKGTKSITTIHDLTWKLFPEYHTPDIIKSHEMKLKRTIALGDIIIVDSENTKTDLYKLYPKAKKNNTVEVLFLGIDERYKKVSDKNQIKKVMKKYVLDSDKKYLLYVGAIEPRKNVDRSIKVFAELIQKKKFADYEYIIAGRAGWKNEHVFNTAEDYGVKNKVHFIGYVENEDLPFLYNSAQCLMYLSSYEGFGLPPLEAAKCGIPTLLYKNSSLQEIMPSHYPFAKEGTEVETLIEVLRKKHGNHDFKVDIPSWKTYADLFMKIIS